MDDQEVPPASVRAISRHLRQRRSDLGITQKQMAHRMGDEKHRSYIARLEAGRDKIAPSLDMCLRMAGALDESIGEFLRATELADIIQIAELQPLPAVKRRLIDLIAGLEEPDADDLEELVRLWFRRKLLLPEGPEPEPLPDVTVEEEQGPPESD